MVFDSLYWPWRLGNFQFQASKLETLYWSVVSASLFHFTAWWHSIRSMKTNEHPFANFSRCIRKLEACPVSPSFRKANFNLWCKWKLSVVCRRCPEGNFTSDITLEWSWHCWCQGQTRDLSDWHFECRSSQTKSLFCSGRSWQWLYVCNPWSLEWPTSKGELGVLWRNQKTSWIWRRDSVLWPRGSKGKVLLSFWEKT